MRSGGVGTLGIYIHTCTHTHTYTCIHCVKRERASGHVLWDWIGLDWIGLDWIGLDCLGKKSKQTARQTL